VLLDSADNEYRVILLKALRSPKVESKQIWDCIQALNNLATN